MLIKKLSTETINLISAGEVIEGPSDILKELLENSVDAKATEITVEVKSAGLELIQIKDNGTGILKNDLLICLEKYTTSKLEKIDDLYSINSFGFRGEALSTINAVSKLKIISSTTEDGKGHLLENNILKEVSSTKGTTIIVEDLFYNVPVRKKFLKSKSFEFSKVYDVFLASVLLNPEITFRFISDKKNIVFQKTTLENRFIQIYGSDIKSKTVSIDVSNNFFTAKGILTNPANPIYLPTNFLFINRRYVFSPQIYKAITDSYKDYLMIQQKPFFILFIDFDPATIDVNVHPKKRVVKLQNEMLFLVELKKELSNILDKLLGRNTPVAEYNSLKDFISLKEPNNYASYSKENSFNKNNTYPAHSFSETQKPLFVHNNSLAQEELNLFEHQITKILGQVHDTFIVCQTTTGMIFIDQHAADERINLEKNRAKFVDFEKQNLISPLKLDYLSDVEKEVLEKNKLLLSSMGFEYTFRDDFVYLVSMPIFLNRFFDKNILFNLLKDLSEGNNEVNKLKDNILKLKSCKESIKANQPLQHYEQVDLIKKLSFCKDKGICAHGRPTIIYFSLKDLEKLFKRIV